ncbi:MAG: PAS domain S-box protein [Pseudomonadales bacterium]|nr:PAS domain S-box protein [Pseudomonadales bacterium]
MIPDQLLASAFKHVFSALPYGMCIVDSEFRYVEVNSAWCNFIGYSKEEVMNMSFLEFTHPDDQALDAELSTQLFDGQIPYFRINKRWICKSGDVVEGSLTATCLHSPDQERWGFAVIVPESQQLTTHGGRDREMLGPQARGLVHEINNLLLIVSGRSELLEHEFGDQHDIAAIKTATQLAGNHTKALLLNSVPASDDGAMTGINEALISLQLVLGPLLPAGIDVQITPHASEIETTLTKPKLIQILMNCVTNALDAIETHGSISIDATYARCGVAQIRIHDDGSGIDAADLPSVTQPFFTTKTPARGTGLGLSIVQSAVIEAGGVFNIQSTKGVGTTVLIEIPGKRLSK